MAISISTLMFLCIVDVKDLVWGNSWANVRCKREYHKNEKRFHAHTTTITVGQKKIANRKKSEAETMKRLNETNTRLTNKEY